MVPAIISAVVALVVLACGHYITTRRERTQFLATKLEELYVSLDQYLPYAMTRASLAEVSNEDMPDSVMERVSFLEEISSKSEMLVLLYFPSLLAEFTELAEVQRNLSLEVIRIGTDAFESDKGYKGPNCLEELDEASASFKNHLAEEKDKLTEKFDFMTLIRRIESWPEDQSASCNCRP